MPGSSEPAWIELWTDGSSSGASEAPGGWAFVLRMEDPKNPGEWIEREGSGADESTTNNRMELMAVIEGLRVLTRPCAVKIHTDSQYVMHAFTRNWIKAWERKRWRKVKNPDLWHELIPLVNRHHVEWKWVAGHAGIAANERCDVLAGEARHALVRALDEEAIEDGLELHPALTL